MAEILPYEEGRLDEVADLLATAYRDNPLHLLLFDEGSRAGDQRRLLFSISLRLLETGDKFVLMEGRRIVGFAHWINYPGCRPSPQAMEEAVPALVEGLPPDVLARIVDWRRAWGEADPETPHCHFGPFAVHPDARGRGFGRRLLQHYCGILDRDGLVGYLETERPQNVEIYRKSGFEVVAQREVLGLPSWFMTRPARGASR